MLKGLSKDYRTESYIADGIFSEELLKQLLNDTTGEQFQSRPGNVQPKGAIEP